MGINVGIIKYLWMVLLLDFLMIRYKFYKATIYFLLPLHFADILTIFLLHIIKKNLWNFL